MDTREVEEAILKRPLPDWLPADQGWVLPHYDGLSIANLPATIAELLGSSLPGALPALPAELWTHWAPGLQRVVMVILDALGYQMLQGMCIRGEGQVFAALADKGRLVPLTSVFPSTTAAALVSLRSGRPPAEHGWLAYELYLRELGVAANSILLCPVWTRRTDLLTEWGLEPESLVPGPTLAQRLAIEGIETKALLATYLKDSGFTKMLYQGVAEIRGHVGAGDFWVQLRHLLAETRNRKGLLTAYWSDLDTVGHYYGQSTEQWEAEFRTLSFLLGREFLASLPAEDRDGTLLLITADHGQIRIPPAHVLVANKDPELSQHLLVPVMGESRAAFMYPRAGRAQAIRSYLEQRFPGWFVVLDSIEVLAAGLMGWPISDETYARTGELIVLARDTHALQRAQAPVMMQGRHGGLTPEEMLVPLIGTRLDAL